MFEEQLVFPFETRVLGMAVTVQGIHMTDDDMPRGEVDDVRQPASVASLVPLHDVVDVGTDFEVLRMVATAT